MTSAMPISAIVIALVTTAFNIYDRKRFYSIEHLRIAQEQSSKLADRTEYLNDRYVFTKDLMSNLSTINQKLAEAEGWIASNPGTNITPENDAIGDLGQQIEAVVVSTVDNQLLLSEDAHRLIRQHLRNGLVSIKHSPDDATLLKGIRELRVQTDAIKEKVREDFQKLP